MFAANNTWQGIIGGLEIWPYNQIPPMISGNINAGITNIISINLDEHIWKYQKGKFNFSECMDSNDEEKCQSIFDPKFEFRYNIYV